MYYLYSIYFLYTSIVTQLFPDNMLHMCTYAYIYYLIYMEYVRYISKIHVLSCMLMLNVY